MSQSSRIERVKSANLSVDGEESVYEHSKQKSVSGVSAVSGNHGVVSSESSMGKAKGIARNGWVVSLVLFGVFLLFVFLMAIAWAPYCLVSRKKKGKLCKLDLEKRSCRRSNLDYGRLFLWSLFFSGIAVFLFWLLSAITAGLVGSIWGGSKSMKMKSSTMSY